MNEQRKPRKEQKAVKTRFIIGDLACQRCNNRWTVEGLNEHRKTVFCPICGEYNGINEAIKRAS